MHCSLIEFYPHFEETLRESLRILVGAEVEKRVNIGMAKDGSGVGGKLFGVSFRVLVPNISFSRPLRTPGYQATVTHQS
jgi:hypothetical protein